MKNLNPRLLPTPLLSPNSTTRSNQHLTKYLGSGASRTNTQAIQSERRARHTFTIFSIVTGLISLDLQCENGSRSTLWHSQSEFRLDRISITQLVLSMPPEIRVVSKVDSEASTLSLLTSFLSLLSSPAEFFEMRSGTKVSLLSSFLALSFAINNVQANYGNFPCGTNDGSSPVSGQVNAPGQSIFWFKSILSSPCRQS